MSTFWIKYSYFIIKLTKKLIGHFKKLVPDGAITNCVEDGIVVVDRSRCQGSRLGGSAYPCGVPRYGADGLVRKMRLGMERISAGKPPASVWT